MKEDQFQYSNGSMWVQTVNKLEIQPLCFTESIDQ